MNLPLRNWSECELAHKDRFKSIIHLRNKVHSHRYHLFNSLVNCSRPINILIFGFTISTIYGLHNEHCIFHTLTILSESLKIWFLTFFVLEKSFSLKTVRHQNYHSLFFLIFPYLTTKTLIFFKKNISQSSWSIKKSCFSLIIQINFFLPPYFIQGSIIFDVSSIGTIKIFCFFEKTPGPINNVKVYYPSNLHQ